MDAKSERYLVVSADCHAGLAREEYRRYLDEQQYPEIRRRYEIGCDAVMWRTDYPHPEGPWPNTVPRLRSDFGEVPIGDERSIADRIGPTPDDVGQDPALVATREQLARANWWKAEYGISW